MEDSRDPFGNLRQVINIFDEEEVVTQERFEELTSQMWRPEIPLRILVRSGCIEVIESDGQETLLRWVSGKEVRKLIEYIAASSKEDLYIP